MQEEILVLENAVKVAERARLINPVVALIGAGGVYLCGQFVNAKIEAKRQGVGIPEVAWLQLLLGGLILLGVAYIALTTAYEKSKPPGIKSYPY